MNPDRKRKENKKGRQMIKDDDDEKERNKTNERTIMALRSSYFTLRRGCARS
jgi:hypothetical protein